MTDDVFWSRRQAAALGVTSGALAVCIALVGYGIFQSVISTPWLRVAWATTLAVAIVAVIARARASRTTVSDRSVLVRNVLGSSEVSVDGIVEVAPMRWTGQVNCVRMVLRSGDSVTASSVSPSQQTELLHAIRARQ